MSVGRVASPFCLLVGETDAPAPVRAKEWVRERGRVRDDFKPLDASAGNPSP